MRYRKKGPREKDLTERYMSGGLDEDRVDAVQRFTARSKNAEQEKIVRTALMRAEEEAANDDLEVLPVGRVTQVFSVYSVVVANGREHLAVVRKTLSRILDTGIVVGDEVRFRVVREPDDEAKTAAPGHTVPGGQPEAVIEQVLPRRTVLTRADSFKGTEQHPIVANAEQMLMVVSLRLPRVKWGLIDRMIVAARSGKLEPIVCLNKIDLAGTVGAGDGSVVSAAPAIDKDLAEAEAVLTHYEAAMGVRVLRTSVERQIGLDDLRNVLRDRTTVLAGHSGVGKSSLIRAIQPHLDLRIGAISGYTDKGRHTTTSAKSYPLDFGGTVIDTPGVKLFGLWGVTPENLTEFFPDVRDGTAPEWRRDSYERIRASLGAEP